MKGFRLVVAVALSVVGAVHADVTTIAKEPPAGPYRSLNELLDLAHFVPGLGTLFVDPASLPVGPYLGYDRNGRLINAIYVIIETGADGFDARADLERRFPGVRIDHVHEERNPGHAGDPEPHRHVIFWLISHEEHLIYLK